MNLLIGITGASGSIYARRLIEKLNSIEGIHISLIFSNYGIEVAKYEGEYERICSLGVKIYDQSNMFASAASGSSKIDAMVVAPCSASTMARIANGISDNLLTRAGDVMIKERRKLIIALRETPLSLIHIENMRKISETGAIVMPLSPSFYSLPKTIEELIDTQIERIISLLGVESDRFEWK